MEAVLTQSLQKRRNLAKIKHIFFCHGKEYRINLALKDPIDTGKAGISLISI